MSRESRNSVQFSAETIAAKPLWLQRQVDAMNKSGEHPKGWPEALAGVVMQQNAAIVAKIVAATLPLPVRQGPATATRPRKTGRVARTRNAGTMTEAAYWGMLRSGLRRLFRFWRPAVAALHAARIPCKGPKGQKWAYLCNDCGKTFPRKRVQIDHVLPCGSLRSYEDVGRFIQLLTPESPDDFRVRCLSCHQAKTNKERTP